MPAPIELRLGDTRYAIVGSSDVIGPCDRHTARRLVEKGLGEHGRQFARWIEALAEQLGGPWVDDPVATVVDALVSGRLVAVRWATAPRLMTEPVPYSLGGGDVDDLRLPFDGPGLGPTRPRPPTIDTPATFVEIELVHQTGGLFPGARFAAELPDGTIVDGILDSSSRWSHRAVTESGTCSLRFYERLELNDSEQRRPSSAPRDPQDPDLSTLVGSIAEISIRTGRPNRVVVTLPAMVPVVGIDLGTFGAGEAFVTAAVAATGDAVADALQERPRLKFSALANSDIASDPQRDKDLSDRRARALVAVLTADQDAFDRIASDDSWGLRHDQAMLRGLGCNPAAIDGIDGDLTRRAVAWFQDEWSRGLHHPDGLDEPIETTGRLDKSTRLALRRAYLIALSPQLSIEQLVQPRTIGCGSFALPPSKLGPAHGGSLALWSTPPSRPFPCREGDPDACLLDDRDPTRRCRFHRETFDIGTHDIPPTFFDFDWLRLPSGSFNLSAISSLPDLTQVRFHVMRDVQDYDGQVRHHHGSLPLPMRGAAVGPAIDGIVRYGVCVALWSPPTDWDPLAWHDWLTDLDPLDGGPVADGAHFHPPLFAIEYDGGWVFGCPPGERIDRFALRNASRTGLALTNNGSFVAFGTADARVVPPRARRTDEHLRIIGWCSYQDRLIEEESRAP